jgi:penicillin-binding protein 2
VNEGGTGVRARLPNIEVCGKTGTAQLASNEFLKGNKSKEMKDNAWFVGFAPRSAPEIVVVAFYEHGEHGQFAAPLARDVIKAYFDKKARLATQTIPPKPVPQPTVGFVRPENPPAAPQETQEKASPTPF